MSERREHEPDGRHWLTCEDCLDAIVGGRAHLSDGDSHMICTLIAALRAAEKRAEEAEREVAQGRKDWAALCELIAVQVGDEDDHDSADATDPAFVEEFDPWACLRSAGAAFHRLAEQRDAAERRAQEAEAERDTWKRQENWMVEEARARLAAVERERDAMRDVLTWLDRRGGLGLDAHRHIREALQSPAGRPPKEP